MILDSKVTKIVLSIVGLCFVALAVLVGITGWDGTTPPVEARQVAGDLESEPIAQPTSLPESEIDSEPSPVTEWTTVTGEPPEAKEGVVPPSEGTTANKAESPLAEKAPSVFPTQSVYINPVLSEAKPGQEISVNVEASFTDHGISGSEILLQFDPAVLQLTGLSTDGVLGSNPLIGVEEKDNQSGTLRYALARRGPTQNTASAEVLAIIKFKVADSARSGSYDLTLTEVKLTDEKFEEITEFDIQVSSVKIAQ